LIAIAMLTFIFNRYLIARYLFSNSHFSVLKGEKSRLYRYTLEILNETLRERHDVLNRKHS